MGGDVASKRPPPHGRCCGQNARVQPLANLTDLALGLASLQRVLARPIDQRATGLYGGFAWASALPEENQRTFAEELADALLMARSGTSLDHIRESIGDWIATTEAWSNADTQARLLTDVPDPLGVDLHG